MKKSFEENLEDIRKIRNDREKMFEDIKKESKTELIIILSIVVLAICAIICLYRF